MIAYLTRHPTAANLLMILFLVLGISSLPKIRRETFPDITPWEVQVRVVHPGATAEDIEEAICQRIEDAVDGVKFVKEVRSDAREGVGTVTIEMEEGADFSEFKDDVTTEVEAIDEFPDQAEEPIIRQLGTTDPVISVLVSGKMTPPHLKAWCEDLKSRLQRLPEVSLVEILGFSDHQLRIELSSAALNRYGLTAADVANTVAQQSLNIPAGAIETRDQDIIVRLLEERRSPEEFENLVIKGGRGGAEILLRDVARIVDVFELDEEKIVFDGQRAAALRISKTKNQDIIRVAKAVKAFVERERERHPQVRLAISQDGSELVLDRLQMLIKNGWQGIILVFLMLWLFFNVRLSFWVVMSLPVSFFGAFYVMPLVGLTVNMLTMVGMLLALGLLMDDGIVIAENIATHRANGKPPLQAAIDGLREVAPGVLSSFMTTVCVLGPLATITGDIGKVLKVVPIILIIVMFVSLIEAFAILPSHLGHALSHGDDRPNRFRRMFDRGIDWVREMIFGRAIDTLLRWRYVWLGCVLGALLTVFGLMAGGVIKFQAFPDLDGDVISAQLILTSGAPLERTEEVVSEVTSALKRVNAQFAARQTNGEDLVKQTYVEFNRNSSAFDNGPHLATINVDLLGAETRVGRIDDIITAWLAEIGDLPDVAQLSITEPSFGPAGRPIEVRLTGPNLDDLKTVATEVSAWFNAFRGVRNLSDDLRHGKPEMRLSLREGAVGLGLNTTSIARQLQAAFKGITADEIQVGPESYEIDVRFNRQEQNTLADLEYFRFKLPNGEYVPIGAVIDASAGRGWSRIARVNGVRTVTVRGDIDSRVTKALPLMEKLKKELLPKLTKAYPDLSVTFEGEVVEGGQTSKSMMAAMILGLTGVFVLLSFQFRSYVEPLVVMFAIPFALIGVFLGHLMVGLDLSMPSMLGFISLSGIVVNDSILLVMFLKRQTSQGISVEKSAAQASRQRFRAILLTSLTTIAGLLPLLFEKSLQAQIIIPLAVSIAFGMMASTVLVLLVIPCLYAILADFGILKPPDTSAVE